MPIFDKYTLSLISEGSGDELLKSVVNQQLSIVNHDAEKNLFYISLDKVLFSNPVETIEKVLEANGYVNNLENILSCLDSFKFVVHARVSEGKKVQGKKYVHDYFPCMSFELPQKHRLGSLLQRFYDEVANYNANKSHTVDALINQEKEQQIKQLKAELADSKKQVGSLKVLAERLSEELIAEKQKDKQTTTESLRTGSLPGNTLLCSVEHVDLKRRVVKVKSLRKTLDIPTHLLDRVPEFRATCLVTLDKDKKVPLGILFFDDKELGSIERRVADLLFVDGDTFKARDSMRNDFQITALNQAELESVASLQRGMKILLSVADDYVVRFSMVEELNGKQFDAAVLEQMAVFDIGRNQLIVGENSEVDDD
ncbi:MAG: hypothetical protein KTR17_00900 [Cellvibrionaceae bacterium]|nr:hypothetical protein [Cellvibrionaceae bacterium]